MGFLLEQIHEGRARQRVVFGVAEQFEPGAVRIHDDAFLHMRDRIGRAFQKILQLFAIFARRGQRGRQGALQTIRKREKILEEIGSQLGARDGAAVERLEKLLAREKELEKKLRAMEQKLASGAGGAASEEDVRDIHGVKVVTRKLDGVDPRTMREMADRMRQKHGSAVVALGSDLGEGKVALLVAVTPDLIAKIKAGDIIKNIAPIVGGTGGGRPDLAQAGGRDASKLDEALARVAALVS